MPQALQGRARFGPFELDLRAGELHHNGQAAVLQEQQLKVLLMLVERDGEIATRDEIRNKLWPNDTVVEFDHGINQAIKNLRRLLGDSAQNPQYIETIARRGYRLMVPVEWQSPSDDSSSGDAPLEEVSDSSESTDSRTARKAGLSVGRLTGRVVSHYRVLEVIGGGGMGLVYRAEDLKLGRAVALKFLPEEVGDDPKARDRFEREAKTVSTLSYPNICPIYEFAEHEGHPFIAMELLQGKTLRDHLAAGRFRLTQPGSLEVAIQIASGLEAAHEKGIVHRDIKPANIFITEKNVAKILDFGVAKIQAADTSESHSTKRWLSGAPENPPQSFGNDPFGAPEGAPLQSHQPGLKPATEEASERRAEARLFHPTEAMSLANARQAGAPAREATLTRTGAKVGTAGYMSPEQIRGEHLDARSDIFSLGLVLYEMATGERAFTGETEAILHEAITHREPKPVLSLAPTLAPGLAGIVDKCLEKQREQRFQAAMQLRVALSELQRAESPVSPSMAGEAEQKSRRQRWIAGLATVAVLLSVIAAVLYQRAHVRPKLTDQDTIVLGDFANLTSDRLFDNSIQQALEVAFGQTPFLNPLSGEKISQILKAMNKPTDEHLTPAVARDVCLRSKSAAYVTGSISDAGNQYRIDLSAIDCKTDRALSSVSSRAEEQNHLIARLGDAAYSLREKLGEPPASLHKFNKPLAEATTASLEALQGFRASEMAAGGPEGIPVLKRAIELDPEFALAYLNLGITYNRLRLSDRKEQTLAKAYLLREQRLARRDQFAAEIQYYGEVTGEYPRLVSTEELAIQEFPRSYRPRNSLGRTHSILGEYEKAAVEIREALHLEPESTPSNVSLARCFIALDRLQDARVVLDYAKAKNLQSYLFHVARYVVGFLQNDRAAMVEEVQWATKKPDIGDVMLKEQSETAAYYGRVREADELMGKAVDVAVKAGAFERAADWRSIKALRSARVGKTARGKRLAQGAVSADSSLHAKVMTAMAFAMAGDTRSALQLVQQLREKYPLNTLLRDRDLPSIEAEVHMQQGRPDLAIAVLEPAVPYELGLLQQFALDSVYVRGEAYLQAGRGQEAASQFRKMLDHPGLLANSVSGPLARLQLGRSLLMTGDKDGARKSYQDFLTLWKDADPDIPVYQQAKAEYSNIPLK